MVPRGAAPQSAARSGELARMAARSDGWSSGRTPSCTTGRVPLPPDAGGRGGRAGRRRRGAGGRRRLRHRQGAAPARRAWHAGRGRRGPPGDGRRGAPAQPGRGRLAGRRVRLRDAGSRSPATRPPTSSRAPRPGTGSTPTSACARPTASCARAAGWRCGGTCPARTTTRRSTTPWPAYAAHAPEVGGLPSIQDPDPDGWPGHRPGLDFGPPLDRGFPWTRAYTTAEWLDLLRTHSTTGCCHRTVWRPSSPPSRMPSMITAGCTTTATFASCGRPSAFGDDAARVRPRGTPPCSPAAGW